MVFVPSTRAFVTPHPSRLYPTGRGWTPLASGMTAGSSSNNETATLDYNDASVNSADDSLAILDSDYHLELATYRARKELAMGLRKCPLFKSLSDKDIEGITRKIRQVAVPEGEQIIVQGSVPGDEGAMFFLESGMLECYNQDTKEVFVTYNKRWDYFGELALIFDQPRAASIVAKEDSIVWELRSEDFVSEIADAPLYPIAREMMLKKYQVKSLQDAISSVSAEELLDLFRARMRPKRSPVSLHSTLATITFGCFLCTLIFSWKPGIDEFGFPMFLDIDRCANVLPNRITGFLFAVTSVLGTSRIPKRAPMCRRLTFDSLTLVSCLGWVVGDSNLGGLQSGYTFDAWAFPGNVVIAGLCLLCIRQILLMIDDAIAGPMKGKDSIPFQNTRINAVIASTVLNSLVLIPILFAVPMLGSLEFYDHSIAPFYHEDGYTGTVTNTSLIFQGLVGVAALLMTLLHTKKVNEATASGVMFLTIVVTMYDAFRLVFAVARAQLTGDFHVLNQAAPHVGENLDGIARLLSEFHLPQFFAAALAFTVINAARKLHLVSNPSNDEKTPSSWPFRDV